MCAFSLNFYNFLVVGKLFQGNYEKAYTST